jgi:hypothetical protein
MPNMSGTENTPKPVNCSPSDPKAIKQRILAAMTVAQADNPATVNSAVAVCYEAYDRAYKEAIAQKLSHCDSQCCGDKAYRLALPPLAGRENIQNFVACVAQGIVLTVFDRIDATRLLYAAQIAHSTCEPRQPLRQPGRPRTQPNDATTPPAS